MKNKYQSALIIFLLLLTGSCAMRGSSIPNHVNEMRENIESRYAFFMKSDERDYLKACMVVECINQWVERFCSIRDCDEINGRISNIENELLSRDLDIPGFTFRINGGLRGNVAHVYLLYGEPAYKDQMIENDFLTDMMVWVYVDEAGDQYRFLFYRKSGVGSYRIFEYQWLRYYDQLNELSKHRGNTVELLAAVNDELVRKDYDYVFRSAMYQFSSSISNPHGILGAPDTYEDIIENLGIQAVGIPYIPEELEFKFSDYHSFIPARFGFRMSDDQIPEFYFISQFSSFDWALRESEAQCYMHLTLFFTNRDTGIVFYYETFVTMGISNKMLENSERYFPFIIPSTSDKPLISDAHISSLEDLSSGSYAVEAYLKNVYTLKYNVWLLDVEIS